MYQLMQQTGNISHWLHREANQNQDSTEGVGAKMITVLTKLMIILVFLARRCIVYFFAVSFLIDDGHLASY